MRRLLNNLDRRPWLQCVVVLVVFCILWAYRQPNFPPPWFDEGLNISAAAALAREGQYALPDPGGARVLDPAIQTGPTVILPLALTFRLLGVDMMTARLVMLPFALLALAVLLLIARRLMGAPFWVTALLLFAGSREDYTSYLYMSRQVLGETPALALSLAGLWLWWQTLEGRLKRAPGLALCGLAWGLAMVTKSQVLLLLPASLALICALDRLYYHQASWKDYLIPAAVAALCVAGWYLAQYWVAGADRFQLNVMILRDGMSKFVLGINPRYWLNALRVILYSGWLLWGLPGLIWAIVKSRRQNQSGFYHLTLLALPTLALFWYVFLSVGWARYAFYVFVPSAVWAAGLLVEVWRSSGPFSALPARRLLAGGVFLLYLVGNGWSFGQKLVAPMDTGFDEMVEFLQTRVDPEAKIEAFEWELRPFVPQTIHFPSTFVANAFAAAIYSGEEAPVELYDPWAVEPHYIIDGPMSSWTGVYRQRIQQNTERVALFNLYALYRLK